MSGLQKLKSLVVGLIILFASLGSASSADAQEWPAWTNGPYYVTNSYDTTYIGWGWYGPWTIWPPVFVPAGFSYWSYYNYQPYYATFAAISYSPSTDKFGIAWGNAYQNEAFNNANSYCGKEDCHPIAWVQGGCLSIASGPKGEFMGWAYNPNLAAAEGYAKTACHRASKNTVTCTSRAWTCSF